MSNQTHTPGPWRVNGASVWSDAGYVADLSSPRGPDERDANARLIATAPELLACCKAAQIVLKNEAIVLTALNLAIAKAEDRGHG